MDPLYHPPLQSFGRQASSHEMNQAAMNLHRDVTGCFGLLDELQERIDRMNLSIGIENQILASRIAKILEAKEQSDPDAVWLDTEHVSVPDEEEELPCRVDLLYRFVTVPWETASSRIVLRHPRTGEMYVQGQDTIQVEPPLEGHQVETSPMLAVTGEHKNFYFRIEEVLEEETPMELFYRLRLPERAVTQQDTNVITFHGYPLGVHLSAVEYETSSYVRPVPGVPLGEILGPWQFFVPLNDLQEITFHLQTTHGIEMGDKTLRALGVRYVNLAYCLFQAGTHKACFHYSLPPGQHNITQVVPKFLNEDVLPTDQALYSLGYQVYEDGEIKTESGALPLIAQGDELVIAVTLQSSPDRLVAPQLQGVRLSITTIEE